MTLAFAHAQRRTGYERREVPSVRERDDVIGVAVPEPHRHSYVAHRKAPRPAEQHEVVDERGEVTARAADEIVDEHRLHLRPREHTLITFR
jgi:hypothetical protein